MIGADLTAWTDGFQAGRRRGLEDIAAEAAGRSTRDASHRGHPGEPPEGDDPNWLDGFLEGYAAGRREMRGAA